MTASAGLRARLRALKVLAGPFEPFEIGDAADDPQGQFLNWLRAAIAAGVPEPHAMTLSTVDAQGCPDARVLILKDVDALGWHFAASSRSPKGRQIAGRNVVCLTFYWQTLGRQVRVRGTAVDVGAEAGAADFQARPAGSRAGALTDRQSDVLDDPGQLDRAVAEQRERIAQDPGLVAPSWTVYAVEPRQVEFWQADIDRRHTRLRYTRTAQGWVRERLWP